MANSGSVYLQLIVVRKHICLLIDIDPIVGSTKMFEITFNEIWSILHFRALKTYYFFKYFVKLCEILRVI